MPHRHPARRGSWQYIRQVGSRRGTRSGSAEENDQSFAVGLVGCLIFPMIFVGSFGALMLTRWLPPSIAIFTSGAVLCILGVGMMRLKWTPSLRDGCAS